MWNFDSIQWRVWHSRHAAERLTFSVWPLVHFGWCCFSLQFHLPWELKYGFIAWGLPPRRLYARGATMTNADFGVAGRGGSESLLRCDYSCRSHGSKCTEDDWILDPKRQRNCCQAIVCVKWVTQGTIGLQMCFVLMNCGDEFRNSMPRQNFDCPKNANAFSRSDSSTRIEI